MNQIWSMTFIKIRYLGIETMRKLWIVNSHLIPSSPLPILFKNLEYIDISIKRRSLDLIYIMCQ